MSKLILLRHGESMWNKANLFTGWVDIPLTDKGIQEAIDAGKNIPHSIDHVFTSTLMRAKQTLSIALAYHHSKKTPVFCHPEDKKIHAWETIYGSKAEVIPIHQAWQLNERMYGELQGLNKDETRNKFGDEQVKIWRRSFNVAPPSGESLKDCAERTLPYFRDMILPCLAKNENVLIVAHGNSLRSIVMFLDHLNEDEVTKLEIPLGKPIEYTYESGKFQR